MAVLVCIIAIMKKKMVNWLKIVKNNYLAHSAWVKNSGHM